MAEEEAQASVDIFLAGGACLSFGWGLRPMVVSLIEAVMTHCRYFIINRGPRCTFEAACATKASIERGNTPLSSSRTAKNPSHTHRLFKRQRLSGWLERDVNGFDRILTVVWHFLASTTCIMLGQSEAHRVGIDRILE